MKQVTSNPVAIAQASLSGIKTDVVTGDGIMTSAHQNFITHTSQQAKALLDMYGQLIQLDTLWAGAPNYQAGITQGDIDGVPSFEQTGLTTAVLADAEFILSTIKGNITNAIAALTVLANLP